MWPEYGKDGDALYRRHPSVSSAPCLPAAVVSPRALRVEAGDYAQLQADIDLICVGLEDQ